MDKATLEKQIDLAAARYAEKKDPAVRQEIEQLSHRLAEFRHLSTLEDALERCRDVDMRTLEVKTALDELAKATPESWPISQFATALDNEEGRCKIRSRVRSRPARSRNTSRCCAIMSIG